ncbi:MAG: trypsin-like peptidase domain-containing protein [Candidatus Dormibacteria bacterium]
MALLLVASLAVLAGSGLAILGRHLTPAHQTTRHSPSPIAPTPTQSAAARQLDAVAQADLPEIVTVVAVGPSAEELGTGWPIDDAGDFITNDHVVHTGQSFHVLLASGEQYQANVTNDDPSLDLAEVHVYGLREQPLPMDATPPSVGEPVVVLAAQGATGHEPITESMVNGLNQSATVGDAVPGELSNYTGLIRIPAHIYSGNSGGPVLVKDGDVVGILTLAAANGSGAFAIPIAQVQQEIAAWLRG